MTIVNGGRTSRLSGRAGRPASKPWFNKLKDAFTAKGNNSC